MNKQDKELLEKSVNPFTTDLTIPVRVFKTIRKIVDVQDIQEGIITVKKYYELLNANDDLEWLLPEITEDFIKEK